MAAARARAVQGLAAEIAAEREREPDSLFPWAVLALEGHLEKQIGTASEETA